jgi:hypothetical protein
MTSDGHEHPIGTRTSEKTCATALNARLGCEFEKHRLEAGEEASLNGCT